MITTTIVGEMITREAEQTECVVVIESLESFQKNMKDREFDALVASCRKLGGIFTHFNDVANIYPGRFIFVNKDGDEFQQLFCLLHEIEHFTCWNTNCDCRDGDQSDREYCAFLRSAVKILDSNYDNTVKYDLLVMFVKQIEKKANGNTRHHFYKKAAKEMMDNDIWIECKRFVAVRELAHILIPPE